MWRERRKVTIPIIAIPLVVVTVHGALIRPLIDLALTGSMDYVYRAYRWGDSEIYDCEKSPSRPVQIAAPAFHFKSVSACELVP